MGLTEAAELVTCIVPVYNGAAYLGTALDSILAQDHRPIEVIVVDDGSTDESARLASSYGPPVHLLCQANRGPAVARNSGLRAAKGAFICFLDADDIYRPGKLNRQLERFVADPKLEVSLCIAENFWEEGLEDEERRYQANGRLRMSHSFDTILARRSVFQQIGSLDPTLVAGEEQLDWFSRLLDSAPVIEVLDEVLVSRRMHAASRTHNTPTLDPFVDLVKRRLDQRRLDQGS